MHPAPRDVENIRPAAARWPVALVWAGAPLCIAGFVQHRLWTQWASGRFAELLILAAAAAALAWPLHRVARCSWSSAILLIWVAALLPFAGVTPVLATLLVALAAIALGSWIAADRPFALQGLMGVTVLGGTLGWLLPLPLHRSWLYLSVCLLVIAVRWRWLRASIGSTATRWAAAVSAAPRAAPVAVMILGLASTACWIPTLQHDDVGYHLRLPWELLTHARYAPDPESHIWALAPWLGDVVQAVPLVISGAEARGPVNALWLLAAACGVWTLAGLTGGSAAGRWWAVALFASLPLTAALATGMQTELPTAAILIWLTVVVLQPARGDRRALVAAAVLCGALVALKFGAACFALLLLPLAIARHGRSIVPAAGAVVTTLLIGSSSYVYAWAVSGNPFLPLFSARFPSRFLPAAIDDPRWQTGFSWTIPWDLTFDTQHYFEDFAGSAGFVLVALAGAWLLTFLHRPTRLVGLVATILLIAPLTQIQYLRYAYPGIVLLVPVLVVTVMHADTRRGAWLLAAVCVLNLAFQSNAQWMLRTGALKQTILAAGNDRPLFEKYVPERELIARMHDSLGPGSRVLSLEGEHPFVAELGTRGLSNAWYNPGFQAGARVADLDATGQTWLALVRRKGITDVIVRPGALVPGQRAGLALAQGELRYEVAGAQWWHLPRER